MSRLKRRSRYARGRAALDDAQEFDLLLGPDPLRPAFTSDQARREAWLQHRSEVLSYDVDYPYARPDTMPSHAMITFELGGFRPGERMREAAQRLRREGKLPLNSTERTRIRTQ